MNFFSKMRIRYQLLILAVSTVLIIISIFSAYYSESKTIVVKKNTEYTAETISQIKQNVTGFYEGVDRLVTSMSYTLLIQNCMLETDKLKKFDLDRQTVDLLNKTQKVIGNGVMDIVILGDNGNVYTLNGNADFIEESIAQFNGKNSAYFTEMKEKKYAGHTYKYFIAGMQVVSVDENYSGIGSKIGYFCMLLDANAVSPDIGEKFGADSNKFYLVDRENKVFSSNDNIATGKSFDIIDNLQDYKSGTYRQDVKGMKSLIQIDDLPGFGGKIISIVPEEELFKELTVLRRKALLLFAAAIALLSIPFSMIINNILHPLRKFMSFINNVKSGNPNSLKNRIQLGGYTEMSVMSQEFNGMLDEIDSLTHRLVDTKTMLYQSELEKKQSELAFLQSQINPHFLYNTLESIKGIASVKGVNEIKEMTAALSRIFRYSIKGMEEVNVHEEVDVVKSYIQIQQIRFTNRFDVVYDFTQEVLGCKMPKMILQPVVENAIYHGLEPMLEKGLLVLSGKIDESNDIIISIKDNGAGIEEKTLEELKRTLDREIAADLVPGTMGIGIVNVNNRIKLKYGDRYGIKVESQPGSGTEILIIIPSGG